MVVYCSNELTEVGHSCYPIVRDISNLLVMPTSVIVMLIPNPKTKCLQGRRQMKDNPTGSHNARSRARCKITSEIE